jgi:hypothetical protein
MKTLFFIWFLFFVVASCRFIVRLGYFLLACFMLLIVLLFGSIMALAAEPYGAVASPDGRTYSQHRQDRYGPSEPHAGGIEAHRRGDWYEYDSGQPGAYRVYGGTVVTGPAQDPGCGGGPGQYACPNPIFIPDNGARPCRITAGIGCVD